MTRTVLDKEVRRSQLIDASIAVFATKGYRSASITDIIDTAKVARGTFYLYFDSKLDAFHAVMDRYLDLYREVLEREVSRSYDNPLSVRGRIRESLMEWLSFFNRNRLLAKIVFREANAIEPDYEQKCIAMLDVCFKHWAESIIRFQKMGFVRKDLDPDFLNLCFSGIMINVVLHEIIPKDKVDLDKIADQWIEFIEHGVKGKGWLG